MTKASLLSSSRLDAAIEHLLVGKPMPQGRPLLGIEVERLILHRETDASAPLEFCRRLFADLVDHLGAVPIEDGGVLHKMTAGRFGLSMEPGGQLEFDSEPCPDLRTLDDLLGGAMRSIEQRLASTPYRLVSLGHAPVTPVEQIGLLPRARYRIMDSEMPARGSLSRNMMRATAGFQLTYDITDREDAGRKLALLNRLTPLLAALTANSRQVGGTDSGYASYRHRIWWDTDTTRVGIPEGGLDADTAVSGYVRFARRAFALFVHGRHGLVAAPQRPFEELVAAGGVTEADLALHMTSLFPFVRLRNYLEVRCFDTVEWELARSVSALVSGIVYCPRALARTEALSDALAVREPLAQRQLHLDAARHGLDALTPGGRSLRDLLGELIGISTSKIGSPDCDWASAADLEAVRERSVATA